jgi:hypothetical protein
MAISSRATPTDSMPTRKQQPELMDLKNARLYAAQVFWAIIRLDGANIEVLSASI